MQKWEYIFAKLRSMSDKYISLSLDESFVLLRSWRRNSTKLMLKLSSTSGVSFEGVV